MATENPAEGQDPPDCDHAGLDRAEQALKEAGIELKEARSELERAEHNLEDAEKELEAERHRAHEVVVIVDRQPHTVVAGCYEVAKFKVLVGVAADRELDLLKDGQLQPLDDTGHIEVCGHEVFVSHVRTGSSA